MQCVYIYIVKNTHTHIYIYIYHHEIFLVFCSQPKMVCTAFYFKCTCQAGGRTAAPCRAVGGLQGRAWGPQTVGVFENQQVIDFTVMLYTHTYRQTYRQTDIQTDIHTDRQTDIHTDRQTNRQTDKQTDRHAYIHIIHTYIHSHTHIYIYIYMYTHCGLVSGQTLTFQDVNAIS